MLTRGGRETPRAASELELATADEERWGDWATAEQEQRHCKRGWRRAVRRLLLTGIAWYRSIVYSGAVGAARLARPDQLVEAHSLLGHASWSSVSSRSASAAGEAGLCWVCEGLKGEVEGSEEGQRWAERGAAQL